MPSGAILAAATIDCDLDRADLGRQLEMPLLVLWGANSSVGKRFADNLYATYERSLTSALGSLYVFYDVSRRLTLRAQAGERTSVDLILRISHD